MLAHNFDVLSLLTTCRNYTSDLDRLQCIIDAAPSTPSTILATTTYYIHPKILAAGSLAVAAMHGQGESHAASSRRLLPEAASQLFKTLTFRCRSNLS